MFSLPCKILLALVLLFGLCSTPVVFAYGEADAGAGGDVGGADAGGNVTGTGDTIGAAMGGMPPGINPTGCGCSRSVPPGYEPAGNVSTSEAGWEDDKEAIIDFITNPDEDSVDEHFTKFTTLLEDLTQTDEDKRVILETLTNVYIDIRLSYPELSHKDAMRWAARTLSIIIYRIQNPLPPLEEAE